MIIGFNAILISPNYTGGVNTYSFGLLEGLLRRKGDHGVTIFCSIHNEHVFEKYRDDGAALEVFDDRQVRYRLGYRITRRLLKRSTAGLYLAASKFFYAPLMRSIDRHCDLLYTPTSVSFPFGTTVPEVLSMHDIQHEHFPEFFDSKELEQRIVTCGLSTGNASVIQASSTFIKEDLLEHYPGLKADRIAIIPEGVDIDFFATARHPEETRKKYGLPERFLFYPAQLWHHKDHLTLLKALLLYRERHGEDVPLVLTGTKQTSGEIVTDFIEEHDMSTVRYLGRVPFEDLIDLYHLACLLISASLHESSCLPVLEAIAAGTPVLVSDIDPNVEMGRTLQMNTFRTGDPDSLCETLHRCLGNEALLDGQADHNSAHIGRYSWNTIAEKYIDLFEKIIPN